MQYIASMSDDPIQVPIGLTTEGLIGRRYLARVIDTIVIGVVAVMVTNLVRAALAQTEGSLWSALLTLFALLVSWIGYGAILESSKWQATLGNRLTGLRVYDVRGGRLTLPRAAGRNLVKDGPFLLFGLVPGGQSGQLLSILWLGCHLVVLHRSAVYRPSMTAPVKRGWLLPKRQPSFI